MYWWHHLVLRMSKIYLHSILFWDKTTKMQKNYKDWFNYQIFGQFCSHTSGHVAFLNIHIQKCKKLRANLRGCLHTVLILYLRPYQASYQFPCQKWAVIKFEKHTQATEDYNLIRGAARNCFAAKTSHETLLFRQDVASGDSGDICICTLMMPF